MELVPTNRLVRKRNSNLQKQLDVTLQILGEEYRQAKERLYKDERDCGKFLQSLYSTVPGLHSYGQPDTRAMNTHAMLRERRHSVSVSVDDGGSESHAHHEAPVKRPSSRQDFLLRKAPCPASSFGGHYGPDPDREDEGAVQARPGRDSPTKGGGAGGGAGSGAGVPAPGKRRIPADAGKGGVGGVGGVGQKPSSAASGGGARPGTAGRQRPASGHEPQGSQGQGSQLPARPATAYSQQQLRDQRFGRGAYTDHDRSIHDRVIRKFKFIFDPETKARSFNLSTIATPIVVVEGSERDGGHGGQPGGGRSPRGKALVNGHPGPGDGKRHVGWSSGGGQSTRGRRVGVVSAPSSARHDRRTPAPHASSPAGKHQIRPASSRLPSSSPVNGTKPRPLTARAHLDPKIQSLALQRSAPARPAGSERSPSPSPPSPSPHGEPGRKAASLVPVPAGPHHNDSGRSTPTPCQSNAATRPETPSRLHAAGEAPRPQARSPSPQHPHPHPSSVSFSNQLQVPGGSPAPGSAPHPPRPVSPGAEAPRRWSTIRNSVRRTSHRLSDASEVAPPPVELLERLMRAGSVPGGRRPQQPKTAPSKSELGLRSMPAPRQTVVGILAQIENQKAYTRNLLSTSKELQQAVKKLVPWEDAHDLFDDW